VILATTRGNVARRSVAAVIPERSGAYAAAVNVTPESAVGVPACDAAITLAAQAVASMRLLVWRGQGFERRPVTTTWQARLFNRAMPNTQQSRFEFWETVEASLTARGNAYVWRTRDDTGRVVALWALHPDQVSVDVVTVRPRGKTIVYRVDVGGGWLDPTGSATAHGGSAEVTSDTILHIRGPHGGGRVVAPSPIERHRSTIGAAIAAQAYQEAFYTRGTGGGHVIVFPAELPIRQVREAKRLWDESNAGVGNAHGTRVLSGGAQFVPVTLSQQDAEYVESARLTVQDVARIFRVPASLIDGGSDTGRPISPEHEQTRWARYHLTPRLLRLEAALEADPFLFGDGSRDYPMFDRTRMVTGDVVAEAEADVKLVQAGIDLPDEARARRGQPPLPNGVGMIPQITPVGGAPNPNTPAVPAVTDAAATGQDDQEA
jgi:HK97 family phage portal protein